MSSRTPPESAFPLPTQDLPGGSRALQTSDLAARTTSDLNGRLLETADLGLPKADGGAMPEMESLVEQLETSPDERRGARRHRLVGMAIAVELKNGVRGRVREASVTGGLFVELVGALPDAKRVKVNASLPNGHAMTFSGAITRRAEDGFAVKLDVDDRGTAFLNVFIAIAKERANAEPLVLEMAASDNADEAEVRLAGLWHDVLQAPKEDGPNQRFINAALSAGRLDLATERYRQGLAKEPSFEARLVHIGKLLSFAAFQARGDDKKAVAKKGSAMRWGIALLMCLVTAMGLVYAKTRRRPAPEPAESFVIPAEGPTPSFGRPAPAPEEAAPAEEAAPTAAP
ncbi:MAG: hypothetical protein U1E65_16930 [Myxococcota bacterium]